MGLFSFFILFSILTINATTILSDGYYNDTDIQSVGLNLTINITKPLYFSAIISNNSIYFENIRPGLSTAETLSFNITETNKMYSGSDLPYISGQSQDYLSKTVNITSNLASQLNITIENIAISTRTCNDILSYSTAGSNTCTNGIINSSNFNVKNGINSYKINFIIGGTTGGGGGSSILDTIANKTQGIIDNIKKNTDGTAIAIGVIILVLIGIGFFIDRRR